MQHATGHPPTLDQLRARREDILRVAAAHRVTNVRVFGSVACGDADADSDVDILVDVPFDYRGIAYFGLLADLERALEPVVGYPVDVVAGAGRVPPEGQRAHDRMTRDALAL